MLIARAAPDKHTSRIKRRRGATIYNQDAPDYQSRRCTDAELQDVLSYLKQDNPQNRFNSDAKKELAQLIYNLKLDPPFKYSVGQSHTLRANLKNKMVRAGLMGWDGGYHVKGSAAKMSLARPTTLFAAVVNRHCQLKHGDGHIGYYGDPETLNQLIAFNVFLAQHPITYANGELDPTHRFNYVKTKGGDTVIRQRLIHDIHNKKSELL